MIELAQALKEVIKKVDFVEVLTLNPNGCLKQALLLAALELTFKTVALRQKDLHLSKEKEFNLDLHDLLQACSCLLKDPLLAFVNHSRILAEETLVSAAQPKPRQI